MSQPVAIDAYNYTNMVDNFASDVVKKLFSCTWKHVAYDMFCYRDNLDRLDQQGPLVLEDLGYETSFDLQQPFLINLVPSRHISCLQ